MVETQSVTTIDLVENYRFRVGFDNEAKTELIMDEPRPVGEGAGPNASTVLAAAVGNCLTASLLFCLRKARIDIADIKSTAKVTVARSEEGYWRIQKLDILLEPDVKSHDEPRMKRCLEIFENYCVVTSSVRKGIQVNVEVKP